MAAQNLEFTIEEAIEKIGFGPFQVLLSFLCAMIWLADAMVLMILSTLPFLLKCHWELSSTEQAVVTSMVFAGALIGSVFWGVFGDTLGRKKAIIGMEIVVLTFGVLSAAKLTSSDEKIPGYPWILLCRFGVGFGSSCIPQVSTYYIEFVPRKLRAVCSVFVSGWWSVGTIIGASLAYGVIGESNLSWHWYVGLSASPVVIVIALIPFFPESARFCLVKGDKEKALRVLRKVAWLNRKTLPAGSIVSDERNMRLHDVSASINGSVEDASYRENQPLINAKMSTNHREGEDPNKLIGKFALLFQRGKWRLTLLLFILWFGFSWLYYGNILLTSTLFEHNPHCGVREVSSLNNSTCADDLKTGDYLKIMWTAAAEIPGTIFTIIVIEVIGRKLTLAFDFTIIIAGFCLLFLCTSQALLTLFLFLIRAFTSSVVRTIYIYTGEVYPTKVRGIAIGLLNAISRVGAVTTPFVAQVLFQVSDYATISVYACSGFVMLVAALLLPLETKGTSLRDER